MLMLFRIFKDIPLETCLANYAKVYNDVFINEISNVQLKYQLMEVMLVEQWELDSFLVPFRHNFLNQTSRQIDYTRSKEFILCLKQFIAKIKKIDFENGED